MTTEYILYRIAPARQPDFVEAITSSCRFLAEDPRCLGYQLSQGEEDPENFIWRIEWTSTEQHLNGFRKSPAFADFFLLVKPFFTDIQEMSHYRPLLSGQPGSSASQ